MQKRVGRTGEQRDHVKLAAVAADQNDEARAVCLDELSRVHAAVRVVHRVPKVEACNVM